MINYGTDISNTSGVFPDTVAINETTPGAQDGTPFIKAYIDDQWGFNQALMDYVGLVPDSVQESPGASQRMEALRRAFGYPGEIVAWAGNEDPALKGVRLIPLTGAGVLRSVYPELDDAVYVGDSLNPTASAFYHATDAAGTSRSTTGSYLILPDSRGYALRGLDVSGTVDPQGATRDLGNVQDHAFQRHRHKVGSSTNDHIRTSANIAAGADWIGAESASSASIFAYFTNIGNESATETRMANIAVTWAIRY